MTVPSKVLLFAAVMTICAAGAAKAAPVNEASGIAAPASPAKTAEAEKEPPQLGLEKSLKEAQDSLVQKREELAKLKHRWMVRKGRLPKKEEIRDYEKKLQEGKAKPGDNPYVNKSPLSTPVPAREAYYKKLAEVRQEEEKVRRLSEELETARRTQR